MCTHTYTPTIFGDLWTALVVNTLLSQVGLVGGWVPGINPVQLGSKQLYPLFLVQNELLIEATEFKKPPGIIFPYLTPYPSLGSEIRDTSLGLIPIKCSKAASYEFSSLVRTCFLGADDNVCER